MSRRLTTSGPGLPEFDAAVLGLLKRGENDPHKIVTALIKKHGEQWLVTALSELAEEIAVNRTRDLMRSVRQKAERKAREDALAAAGYSKKRGATKTPVAERLVSIREVRMTTASFANTDVLIPGRGYVKFKNCTEADLDARAAMYEKQSGKAARCAVWYRNAAAQMRAEGVALAGALSDLALYPNGDDAGENAEAVAL